MKIFSIPRPENTLPLGAFVMLPLFSLPLGAWAIEHGHITFATCGMKIAFKQPCLSCGATRATIRLFHGEFLAAVLIQPMIMLIYIAIILWGTVSLISLIRNRLVMIELNRKENLIFKLILLLIPVLNWFYLAWAKI